MSDCRPVILILLLILSFGVMADIKPRPFTATYTLVKGDNEVGEAVLSLKNKDDLIHWQLETKPKGLYSLLTSIKPYSETIMQANAAEYRLMSIHIALNRDEKAQESAKFDWQIHEGAFERKGKQKTAILDGAVYDYLSIHWLGAQMLLNSGTKTEFDFYRKGKLRRSTLVLTSQTQLEINEEKRPVLCYHQTFAKSSRQYEYCYGRENPYMPLKITRIKSGKKPSTLLFKKQK